LYFGSIMTAMKLPKLTISNKVFLPQIGRFHEMTAGRTRNELGTVGGCGDTLPQDAPRPKETGTHPRNK